MSSIQLPPLSARGGESVFSPQASTDAVFRSPRPSKHSNIRVVTRIRPLLEEELKMGKEPAILPLQQDGNPVPNDVDEDLVLNNNSTPMNNKNNNLQSIPLPSSNQSRNSNSNSTNTPKSSLPNPEINTPASSLQLKASKFQTPSSQQISTSLHAGFTPTSKKQFDFDAVLGTDSTQQQTYEAAVGDKVLRHIIRGVNVTIMAYGQTCSGKTYTMQGFSEHDHNSSLIAPEEDAENQCPNSPSYLRLSEHDGIIPRAIHDIFQGKMEYKTSGKGNVSMELTYFEIYNDELRDLLSEEDEFRTLKMLDQGEGGVIVEGLTSVPIDSATQVHELINYAAQRRATSSTNANMQSSRSHAVCTLTVRTSPTSRANNESRESSEVTQAKLTLVDLAGSERIKKTGVVGVQQQESITINKDLFVLGKVVSALADKSRSASKGKQAHIPFRDSKLTRLLRESLGGNCFTVLISCVSPADFDMEESMNTLRYAERARSISNSIKRNVTHEMPSAANFAALQAENKRLKMEISMLQKRVKAEISRDTAGSLLDQDEEEARTPGAAVMARGIIPLPKAGSSQKSHYEKNCSETPAPVWRHFQQLAKYSGDMPEQNSRGVCDKALGIELKEIVTQDKDFNGKERGKSSSNTGQAKSETDVVDGPDQCLAYELSLSATNSTDLTEVDGNMRGETFQAQKQVIDKLQDEFQKLRSSVNEMRGIRTELDKSINMKHQELHTLSIDVKKQKEYLLNTQLELKTLKAQTEVLNNDEPYDDDTSKIEVFLDAVANDRMILSGASPQKSFRSMEYDSTGRRNTPIELEEDTSWESTTNGSIVLNKTVQNSLDELNEKLNVWESKLLDAKFDESKEGMDDPEAGLCTMIDLAANVEEQRKSLKELEKRLSNEQRKNREQEQTISVKNSHVQELQDRIGKLESDLDSMVSQKQQEERESAEKASKLQKEISALEVKLKEEEKRSASFEAHHNFVCQAYDSMAASLHEKISSLRDQARVEKQQYNQELGEFKAAKDDLEYQVESLKERTTELQAKVENEKSLREKSQAERQGLQVEIDDLKGKLETQKAESSIAQDTIRNSLTREIAEFQDQAAHLANELKTTKEKLNVKKVDVSTSTSKESQGDGVKIEDVKCAVMNIITSSSYDSAKEKEDESPETFDSDKVSPDIKSKAENFLSRVGAYIESSSMTGSSAVSSAGTDFRPPKTNQEDLSLCQPAKCTDDKYSVASVLPSSQAEGKEQKVQITNLDMMKDQKVCSCSSNTFAANSEYVEFYLPKISVDCTCGRMSPKTKDEDYENPYSLTSILRPWQVEFLASVGITDPVSLVHANNHRGGLLAKDLRRWRKSMGLPSIRTRSCSVALHIWSRTCKSVVRSVRDQEARGLVPKKPEFLELNVSENNTAISSLGGGPFHVYA